MSDEFQTVSAKRGDRAREIETLRARYRRHREALAALAADAPSELIAADYRRVIADIDVALAKLDDASAPLPPPANEPLRLKTEPGMRPLVTPNAIEDESSAYVHEGSDARTRIFLIAVAAILALAVIAWLIWKAAGPDKPAITETTATSTSATTVSEEGPVTPATTTRRAAATGPALAVTPDTMDYGIIRKGTRATRQYELVNNTDEPMSPQVARSTCRCLYYEHAPVIPPRGKETLTVTVDGAKAKAGPLLESVRVTAKSDPAAVATFDATATIR